MKRKRILNRDLREETIALECTSRYKVTGHRRVAADEEGDTYLYFTTVPYKPRPIKEVRPQRGVRGKAEFSRSRKVVRRIFDMKTPASGSPPKMIAERFLRMFSAKLGIDPNLSELKSLEAPKKSIFGQHVLFQQYVGRTPISGAWIRVDIDHEGRVFNIQNDLVPTAHIEKLGRADFTKSRLELDQAEPIPARVAKSIAIEKAPVGRSGQVHIVGEPELVYLPTKDDPELSWKLVVHCSRPPSEFKAYIHAYSGKFLWWQKITRNATARAWVFDPNPIVNLNNPKLTQRSNVPDAAYREVQLRGLKRSGYLDGEFVSTKPTRRRVCRRTMNFRFWRKEKGFNEVMVYHHLDRMQRHLQALGFVNLTDKPIKVNASARDQDQSYYFPGQKALSFGRGGVDDAEDAEVILHEYGHAIQDAQVPGWGESMEGGAMGEGFGDFLAASFFADWKPARFRRLFGSWDATVLERKPTALPALRCLDCTRRYPRGIKGEVHDDGEIWSACLWELRDSLGRAAAEKLVIAHHHLLNRWAGFEDAAEAMLTTDRQLFGGRYRELIRDVFARRGILR